MREEIRKSLVKNTITTLLDLDTELKIVNI